MKLLNTLLGLTASLAVQVRAKAVFAHFMVGNANNYTQADWETDIGLAQEAHIDAFALNIANDLSGVTPTLQLAFYVASTMGFKLFFSFDYAGNGPWDKLDVISLCGSYCNNPAYYHTNGGPLLTTFEGPDNATDWHDIKAATGSFFVPDWSSLGAKPALQQASGVADGLFNWAAWPWGNLDMNTYTDASYWMYLNESGGKPYMMAASPWFYTNLPGYDKNWLWRGDHIWYDRWVQIIYNQPDFVEIISWNDYGESHYIGPLYDKAMEAFTVGEAAFNYASGMPHDGWRAFLPYVIDLYKFGTATITREGVQGWWRRAAATACADGGTTANTASQLQMEFAPSTVMTDKIFFSALLGSAADVSVTVGGRALAASWTWKPDGGIGIYHGSADFGSATGDVVISVTRSGQTIASINPGNAGSIGTQSCVNGLQNWNPYVASAWGGSVSATPTRKISDQKCINGTGYGNFAGLCDFSCKYGYCDVEACVCRAMGSPLPTPSGIAKAGYPAAGLDASYSGVCAFDCSYGYCPPTACSYSESPLTTPTVSDFSPPACIGGSAIAGSNSPLGGLCSYACNFGFCPYLVCHCDAQGGLHETPAKISGQSGTAAAGVNDHGLCSFACERGYCPAPTCVNTTAAASGPGSGTGTGTGSNLPGTVSLESDQGWPSFTGQNCYKTACSNNPTWDASYQLPAGTIFPDDCPSGQYRRVVCPINETPGDCTWRGGFPACNPTCEPGEVAIATSTSGSNSCIVGEQGLCCKSLTWANLVSSCSWKPRGPLSSPCGEDNQVEVATRKIPWCYFTRNGGCAPGSSIQDSLCCDADFPDCQWASCDNNVCNSQQIELARDPNGNTGNGCNKYVGLDRTNAFSVEQQALCCGNPENVNPFLPTRLDWLFPNLPPDTDIPVYNLTHIDSKLVKNLEAGPLQPFGFVVIDGPADLVSSLSKRDGAHVEFLDCEPGKKHDLKVHTARYVCTNYSEESNCDDVHVGGAVGTIVKLPEECGYATYGVVHDIRESSNQSIPHDIRKLVPRIDGLVREVSFSYDFRKVRRAAASDPVYVRIDYSSMSDWWSEVVDHAPESKRDLSSTILKRFWSASDDKWKDKIASVRKATNGEDNKLLPLSQPSFSNLIYQQTSDTCRALSSKRDLSDDGFLSVYLDGWIISQLRWGYTVVGTISPTLNLEEAHGFYDAEITSQGQIWVDGSGILEIDGTLPETPLFGVDGITDYGWSQPGIVSFKPTLNLAVQMSGTGSLNANFTYDYLTMPGPDMIQTSSAHLGDFSGSVGTEPGAGLRFNGAVTAAPYEEQDVTAKVLAFHISTQSKMHFTLFDYEGSSNGKLGSRDAALASAEFDIDINHRIELLSDGVNIHVIDAYDPITAQILSDNVSPSWVDVTQNLGPGVSPAVAYQGPGTTPPARDPPGLFGQPALTGNFMHCGGPKPPGGTLLCPPMLNMTDSDPDLLDDYDGENAAAAIEDAQLSLRSGHQASDTYPFLDIAEHLRRASTPTKELEPRRTATANPWSITPPSGNVYVSRASPYLTGDSGRVLVAANPQAGFFNLQNQSDCLTGAITGTAGPSTDLSAEHIVEQNLVATGMQFMMTGIVAPSTQSAQLNTLFPQFRVPEALMGANSVFTQPWNSWDPNAPAGTHEDPTLSPEREMWDAIGSVRHPEYMVNLQQAINTFKSRMMRGIAGVAGTRWLTEGWDDTSVANGHARATAALSQLRLYLAVVNYLNHATVHAAFTASLNRINDIFMQFDAAVARNNLNNGVATRSSIMWREYVYRIIIRRTQDSQEQYRQWLWRMRDNWQAEHRRAQATNAPPARMAQINEIITDTVQLLNRYDPITNPGDFVVDTDGLFPDPTDP